MAKNLLYIEALSSIALEHWEVGNDKLDSLSSMQKKALKKEVSPIFALDSWGSFYSEHVPEQAMRWMVALGFGIDSGR